MTYHTLFTVNLFGSIHPQSARDAEPDACVAVAIDAVVKKGDFVLSDCSFRGRASRYVRSFERVNLLDPVGTPERAVSRIDSVLAVALSSEKSVYIIMMPLSAGPARQQLYSDLLRAVEEELVLSETVPLRASVLLRQVYGRRADR
jgi:hypothetical protein